MNSYASCSAVRNTYITHCRLFGCDKSAVNMQTGHWPYLCNSFSNHVKIAQCTFAVCFARCSFTRPSGFAAGSYILSIIFWGEKASVPELCIVAAQ